MIRLRDAVNLGTAASADRAARDDNAVSIYSAPAIVTNEALSLSDSLKSRLAKIGLYSNQDLALHLPLRYEDETHLTPLSHVRVGYYAQIEGVVTDYQVLYRPRRQLIVTLSEQQENIVLRWLHFYGQQVQHFKMGTRIRARGEIREGFFGYEIVHPHYTVLHTETPLPDRLTPIYPTTASVPQTLLRKLIAQALKRVDLRDTLPAAIRAHYQLGSFSEALTLLHQPTPDIAFSTLLERTHPAWTRIKFDELLAQQLSLKKARCIRQQQTAPALPPHGSLLQQMLTQLPFQLTSAQQRVWQEISQDLTAPYPMYRLLQGDVGSGKTIIAVLAALQAIDAGYQVALMAPTEILAEQHFRKLSEWITALDVPMAWLTGGLKKKAKEQIQQQIEEGSARLIIGTHALIQDRITFQRLALVIVDEQHRFGVEQRLALRAKSHLAQPHQLMMSATPIPRTLAMTYFADLEVSSIDQLPPGRIPVTTKLIEQTRRHEVIDRLQGILQAGRQAYWVCPLIEEENEEKISSRKKSKEKLSLSLQAAVDTHTELTQALPHFRIGLIHGRMKSQEKSAVMMEFTQGTLDVLVATTVIEVGVDVPNASLMVIEHAERFGLAQLHQLRGRIGRGASRQTPVCLLLYQKPLSLIAKQRLQIMRESDDGFVIAQRDLQLRGPGEFLGQRQSGTALLRFADLTIDQELAQQACAAAIWMMRDYPDHVEPHLQRWLGCREHFLTT